MGPHPPLVQLTIVVFLSLLLAPRFVIGGLVNITVDDATPNPVTGAAFSYAPPSTWNEGNGCGFCSAKPNASMAYNQTWHDATYTVSAGNVQDGDMQTATLQFNGTAVYVYGIIQPSADYVFFIDGARTGNYTFVPSVPSTVFTYSVLLYANASIPAGAHTLVMQNGGNVLNSSLALLDYAVYTTETDGMQGPSSSSSQVTTATSSDSIPPSNVPLSGTTSEDSSSKSGHNISVIVAAIVPSVIAVLVLVALFTYWRRHRGRRWGTNKAPPSTEFVAQINGRPVVHAPIVVANEGLRPYMVDRDLGNIPPQKGSAFDSDTQGTSSPTIPAITTPTVLPSSLEEISERDGSLTSATPLRTRTGTLSDVASTGVPPSWFPGSEPPPAYGAQ